MRKLLFALLVFAWMAAMVMAQGESLPIASSAASAQQGTLLGTAGLTLGDDWDFYGVRGAYVPIDKLSLFADAGLAQLKGWNTGFGIAGGAMYTLDLKLPVDVAVRGQVAKPFLPDKYGIRLSILECSIGGVIGKDLSEAVKGLTAYGGLGIYHTSVSAGGGDWPDETVDSTTDLGISIGAICGLQNNLSLFAEVSHIDTTFVSGGVIYKF